MNKTLPYLQIARGIAAFIVVCYHTSESVIYYWKFHVLDDFFEMGWCGVDFFFVLSGFIIYYVHSRDLGHRPRWKSYMWKRLVRIYPVYWVIALADLLLIYLASGNGQLHRTEYMDAFSSPSFLLQSLFLIPQGRFPFLGVSWSLCYEMYFYLIFGLGILINKRLLWLLPLIYVAVNIWKAFSPGIAEHSTAVYFLGVSHHLEFMMGMLTAHLYLSSQARVKMGIRLSPAVRWLWIPGVVLFLCTWYANSNFPVIFSRETYPTKLGFGISSGLIIYSIAQWKEIKDTLVNRFALLLGDASYSLYLVHVIIVALFFKVVTRFGLHPRGFIMDGLAFLAVAAICVLAGIFVHKTIEKPILNFFHRRWGKKQVVPAVVK